MTVVQVVIVVRLTPREREDNMDYDDRPMSRFILRPVPANAYRRQGRKVSDTSSIDSTATVRETNADLSPLVSARRAAFELSASKRTGSTGNGPALCVGPAQSIADDVTTDISLSDTMPNIHRIKESVSLSGHGPGSFLSRMWGAATKAQEKGDHGSNINGKASWASAVSIVEPKESHLHLHGVLRPPSCSLSVRSLPKWRRLGL